MQDQLIHPTMEYKNIVSAMEFNTSNMEVEALQVSWLQIPLTFPGLPGELKVQVKTQRGGCWSWLVRRYKTKLSLPLDGLQWRPHNGHLRYNLTPPLFFSWDRKPVFLRIKIRDLCTRASCYYKLGSVDLLSEQHLPDIGFTCLSGKSLEAWRTVRCRAPQVKETARVSEASCESATSFMSASSFLSEAYSESTTSFISASSFMSEASCASEALASPSEKEDLAFRSALRHKSVEVESEAMLVKAKKHQEGKGKGKAKGKGKGGKKGKKKGKDKGETKGKKKGKYKGGKKVKKKGKGKGVLTTSQIMNILRESQEKVIFSKKQDLVEEAETLRSERWQMTTSKTYNVDTIHFEAKMKLVEKLKKVSFRKVWSYCQALFFEMKNKIKKLRFKLQLYYVNPFSLIQNLPYLRLVEKAQHNDNLKLQIKLETRISQLIYRLEEKIVKMIKKMNKKKKKKKKQEVKKKKGGKKQKGKKKGKGGKRKKGGKKQKGKKKQKVGKKGKGEKRKKGVKFEGEAKEDKSVEVESETMLVKAKKPQEGKVKGKSKGMKKEKVKGKSKGTKKVKKKGKSKDVKKGKKKGKGKDVKKGKKKGKGKKTKGKGVPKKEEEYTRKYLSIMFENAAKSMVWFMMSFVLAVMYLFINFKAAGEVKLQTVAFVNVLLLLFCFSSHFHQGRIYIILTTMQIVVALTASTHLLFIFIEFSRQSLIFGENTRRVGRAVAKYSNLFRSMLVHLIEYEKDKKAAKVMMILDYIAATRERMAQGVRAAVLYARHIKSVIDSIKNTFRSLRILETMCKVVVPSLRSYCEATKEEVYKDCRKKVGGFVAFFGICKLVEAIRQFVCGIFYTPFNFMCNFDKMLKKFLNEALQDSLVTKMLVELKEEFMVRVDIEYRFNHTLDYGGGTDKADKSEAFKHFFDYIPSFEAIEPFFEYVSYLIMAKTFLKPMHDIYTFKKDLSFENDCVGSKTLKTLDKKKNKKDRILPLINDDKYNFRETCFSLPSGAKKFHLLLSAYWQSAVVLVVVVICTFFIAFSRLDMSFMSFDELTTLTPESKIQFNEARRAARNYTYPGIFSKSAMDFYKSMKKFTEGEQERVRTFKNFEKKLKEIKPKLVAVDISVLHKLYLWAAVVFICNTLGLLKRLAYGKLLEHFYPKYKENRAKNLMDRIVQKRIEVAEKRAQELARAQQGAKLVATFVPGAGGIVAGKIAKGLEAEKKKQEEILKRYKKEKKDEKEKKNVKKKEKGNKQRGKKKKGKGEGMKKGKKKGKSKGVKKGKGEGMKKGKKKDKLNNTKSKGKGKGEGKGKGKGKSDGKENKGKEGFWAFMGKLIPNINLFFLEKLVCTKCLENTKHKDLQYCAQPECGAALCATCAHECQNRNHGKCFDCKYPLILDTYLEFPLDISPTRSLCEEDLEPWYIDPEARFGWMKPLKLCTACGKNYVLNYLMEECVLCRKGGIRDFDPTMYKGPTRKPGDPYDQVQVPGFAFLDSAQYEQDKRPVFYE